MLTGILIGITLWFIGDIVVFVTLARSRAIRRRVLESLKNVRGYQSAYYDEE